MGRENSETTAGRPMRPWWIRQSVDVRVRLEFRRRVCGWCFFHHTDKGIGARFSRPLAYL